MRETTVRENLIVHSSMNGWGVPGGVGDTAKRYAVYFTAVQSSDHGPAHIVNLVY